MTFRTADLKVIDDPCEDSSFAGVVSAEALRYSIASVAALSLDSALLWVGVRCGMAPWIAGAASYLAGLVLIYALSVRWVFAKRALVDHGKEFVAFAALGVVGVVVTSLVLFVATARLGVGLAVAKVAAAGVGFVTNFISRKLLLFSSDRS